MKIIFIDQPILKGCWRGKLRLKMWKYFEKWKLSILEKMKNEGSMLSLLFIIDLYMEMSIVDDMPRIDETQKTK